MIVSGTSIEDSLWWSDELDVDGKVLGYIQRCHITIIDFGFARALTPDDLSTDIGLDRVAKESEMKGSPQVDLPENHGQDICINDMLHDTSIHNNISNSRGRSLTRSSSSMDVSQSHKRVRDLSALG